MNFYGMYDLPNWLLCGLTVFLFVSFALIGQSLTRKAARSLLGDSDHNDLVGHYLAAFGVFYGITLGLISVGTWENFSDVEAKAAQEASSVAALYRDVSSYAEPKRTELTDALREYTRYVIEEAWPLQQKGIVLKGGTECINSFQQKLVTFEPVTENQKILHAEALRQFNQMIELRRLRLQSVTQGLASTLWLVIFAGAVMNIALT